MKRLLRNVVRVHAIIFQNPEDVFWILQIDLSFERQEFKGLHDNEKESQINRVTSVKYTPRSIIKSKSRRPNHSSTSDKLVQEHSQFSLDF